MKKILSIFIAASLVGGCANTNNEGTFGYDLNFLKQHQQTIVLKANQGQSQVVVVPEYQGRVMTSTADGLNGKSYGWLNYELISDNQLVPKINAFGGEDRFWLGPEGGQYSIFFKPGDDFTVENWQTPASIDSEPFELVNASQTQAEFTKHIKLTNYQNYPFDIRVKRKIAILNKSDIEQNLALKLSNQVKFVGFQSENTLTNTSEQAWSKQSGLLSIWILGMFTPSDSTTVIIPYKNKLKLNSDYFGDVPADKLKTTRNHVLFKGDGKHRAKIGLPAENALPFFGSYDAKNQILTLVEYSMSNNTAYVNSLWKHQQKPYGGDVINSYNDGPFADGSQLGPFYELESSSATKALKPNESITHIHKTYHFEGEFKQLNLIAKQLLNADLNQIEF